MTTEELSLEETNRLYKLCAIPMLLVFFAILAEFTYLMYMNSLKTCFDFITFVGLPLFILFPTSGIVTFEILYYRRIKKSFVFHLRRLTGRMLLLLASGLWFFGLFIIIQPFLFPLVGDRDFIVSSVLSIIIYAFVIIKFRRIVVKLESGKW